MIISMLRYLMMQKLIDRLVEAKEVNLLKEKEPAI